MDAVGFQATAHTDTHDIKCQRCTSFTFWPARVHQTDKIQRAFAAARTYLGKFRGRYLPLGQSMQVKLSVAPLVSEYFPMSHV